MVQPSEQGGKGKGANSKKAKKQNRIGKAGPTGHAGKVAAARGLTTQEMHMVLVERAWDYKVKGHSPREIADAIADEFNIPKPIHHSTIYEWLDAGRKLLTRKIGLHREEHIETVLPRTERQLRYWMPIANGEHRFAIARMEKIGDDYVEVIDDHVFREQAKAAEIVLKTMEQQRKVLGVGLATTEGDADQKTASLTQINVLLQQVIHGQGAAPGAALGQTPLTLEAGDAQFEAI